MDTDTLQQTLKNFLKYSHSLLKKKYRYLFFKKDVKVEALIQLLYSSKREKLQTQRIKVKSSEGLFYQLFLCKDNCTCLCSCCPVVFLHLLCYFCVTPFLFGYILHIFLILLCFYVVSIFLRLLYLFCLVNIFFVVFVFYGFLLLRLLHIFLKSFFDLLRLLCHFNLFSSVVHNIHFSTCCC